jgi:LPS sulfotransferase NodH
VTRPAQPRRSYLVCATPRSGSTLLCEALKATGVAGRPEEYFEAVGATGVPRRPRDYLDGFDEPEALALLADAGTAEAPRYSSLREVRSYADHLERVRRWGTTPNGVFGAKLMWDHVGELAALAGGIPAYRGLAPRDLLPKLFPGVGYVWVRRRDTVRQAVSFWRAMQTHAWRLDADGAAAPRSVPKYSFPAVADLAGRLGEQDAAWERFLAEVDAPVLVLDYEELAADLAAAVAAVLGHLGLTLPAGAPEPPLLRQADELSQAWVDAYGRDAAAIPGPIDALPAV